MALLAAGVAAALAFVPVPLTTLAPVEVAPQDPFVVAAPVAGVVERILVLPGAQVSEGDPLVQLVDTTLRSDFEVAQQRLEVARAKTLRFQQASVEDASAKRELAIAQTEESVAAVERDYARAMLEKSRIKAQQAGVALYGDPRDWMGRPVAVGEAILRVADPRRVEFQIKVPVADAVNLRDGAEARIFLDAAPLQHIEARVVRAAYKAETDPAGIASFMVTARATDPAEGAAPWACGTAKLYGERVSLFCTCCGVPSWRCGGGLTTHACLDPCRGRPARDFGSTAAPAGIAPPAPDRGGQGQGRPAQWKIHDPMSQRF
jgi:multidrug resistance efflux pump